MNRAALFWLLVAACASPAGGDDRAPIIAPSAPAVAPASAPIECGDEPLPVCPLGSFMDATLAPTFKRRDFKALGAHFRTLAGYAPAEYPKWVEWAQRGVDAAAKESTDEVRTVCAGCHRQYRDEYRRDMRARALAVRGESQ
jgi:hypothetical protein